MRTNRCYLALKSFFNVFMTNLILSFCLVCFFVLSLRVLGATASSLQWPISLALGGLGALSFLIGICASIKTVFGENSSVVAQDIEEISLQANVLVSIPLFFLCVLYLKMRKEDVDQVFGF